MAYSDRHYFQRRAREEIDSAMRADSVEAEIAHAGLANLHLRRCVGCAAAETSECRSCILANVCRPVERRRDWIFRPLGSR